MAHQVRQFTATVAAGTLASSPATTPMALGEWVPLTVEVESSAEAAGVVGYYLAASGQQYLPFTTGATREWLVAKAGGHRFTLDDYPTSGDWELVAYNLGAFPHILKVRWELNRVARDTHGTPEMVGGWPEVHETPYVDVIDATFGYVPPGLKISPGR